MTEQKDTLNKYRKSVIDIDKLDEWMSFITKNNTVSKLGAIIAGLKIIVVVAYIFARKSLIKEYEENISQTRRVDNSETNKDEVNQNL